LPSHREIDDDAVVATRAKLEAMREGGATKSGIFCTAALVPMKTSGRSLAATR
jgi:hypothetical protein